MIIGIVSACGVGGRGLSEEFISDKNNKAMFRNHHVLVIYILVNVRKDLQQYP